MCPFIGIRLAHVSLESNSLTIYDYEIYLQYSDHFIFLVWLRCSGYNGRAIRVARQIEFLQTVFIPAPKLEMASSAV